MKLLLLLLKKKKNINKVNEKRYKYLWQSLLLYNKKLIYWINKLVFYLVINIPEGVDGGKTDIICLHG